MDVVRAAAVLLGGLLLAGGPSPVSAEDRGAGGMTGIWQGVLVCTDNAGGEEVNFVSDYLVEITQRGDRLRFRRTSQDGSNEFFVYEGHVVPIDGSERVEALVTACGGNYEVQEMLRLRRVSVSKDGSGSFDGESIFQSTDLPNLPGIRLISTCRYAYDRVSSEDPHVPRCGR